MNCKIVELRVEVEGKTAATYVRSGQYDLILYLLMSRPPPTCGEVLPVLNDGRQTRLMVAISAVDRMKSLGISKLFRSAPGVRLA